MFMKMKFYTFNLLISISYSTFIFVSFIYFICNNLTTTTLEKKMKESWTETGY